MITDCTLPRQARVECTGRKCYRCGWNAGEMERRNRQIKAEGLTLCDDGLERLIIQRAEPFPETREAEL